MLPPGPLGCAPCALTRTGTRYLPTKREGCPGLFWMEIFKKAPQAEATGVCETLCVLHTEGVSFERG